MYDFLVDHALKNVWCTPEQDMQAVVQPKRISPPEGVFNRVDVLHRTRTLPLPLTRFHVYSIGQLHPLLMNLFPVMRTWTKLSEACSKQSLVADVYVNSGVQLPRTEVWYMVTREKDLIIAVKDQRVNIPAANLITMPLFVRVYSNAFYNTLRADGANDVIYVDGGTLLDAAGITALQTKYLLWKAKGGLTSAYVNGYLVSEINLITVKPGDVAEFVYDASVKRVVDYTVGDLENFESILDLKRKYLLHYPGPAEEIIDYQDDLDLFLIKRGTGTTYQGVYFHRNAGDTVRMVTHKDYAVPTAYVQGFALDNNWADVEGLVLRVVIRKAGYDRPLVNEDSRIQELYKLGDLDLTQALLGPDSVVENWRADYLENAWYTKVMRSTADEITGAVVEDAYGYNAISSLLGMTPALCYDLSGQQVADVPYGLQVRATAYEYDLNGYLLGWFTHLEGTRYPARDDRTQLVEMVVGDVSDRLDETYGDKFVPLDLTSNYRMYTCPIVDGVVTNQWVDVTATGLYQISGNMLTWLTDPATTYTLVRSDRTMLGYTLDLSAADGLLRFTLMHRQLRNGQVLAWPMQIQMGELDLWLNGKSMIEGIDYIVHFPQIVVFNKEFLINPRTQTQKIDVRFSGFCRADLTREVPVDVGYIEYGMLSHNNRYDVRDDKVMRIVVDGAVYERSELKFAEDTPAIVVTDARNGAPYLLRDIVVPMRGYTDKKTYEMRAHSQEIDERISAYMTLKFPQPVQTLPSAIPAKYAIYSPFCNKIMRDLMSGVLSDPRIKQFYTDEDVREIVQPYMWLLDYDPTQDTNVPDEHYVNIHPHNEPTVVDIDIYWYKFVSRCVKLFLNDRVNLSHFLRLTTP
ncbi:hypothetical protein D3C71_78630 [compost metagenome]